MKKWLINSILSLLVLAGLFIVLHITAIDYMVAVILLALFIFLKFSKRLYSEKYNYLALGLLYVLVVVSAKAMSIYTDISPYFIPVGMASMLCALLFNDLALMLIITAALSASVGLIAGGDLYLSCVLFSGGFFGGFLVLNVRRRSQIVSAGIISGIIQALVSLLAIEVNSGIDLRHYLLPNFFNGLLTGFLVSGVLPVFEYLFDIATNIKLLELSDFNHPLLRSMVLEAPGTYHHSLIVGNLSEAAAEAIGANSLLARVGAYYHDIGKIDKAEYFIENQPPDEPLTHDKLKPSISKMVIMNHVREGKDLARKYHLNQKIIDFIEQHHGTSLVFYFYYRALEDGSTEQKVEEEGFRYSGPKPQARETAIVLLADSVEGATRALGERTPKKIDELVHKIINNKFIDGQLDECDLTLSDLEVIASVFAKILSAVYHARITYPEINGEHSDNKPTA